MMRDLLTDKVYRFTHREGLFSAPCHVVVGVSGGADSMTLLHILQNWPEDALELTVVHVNHGIRGENADRDEQFVREYCEKHSIRFISCSADVGEVARNRHLSMEEAGRMVRYDFFEKVRAEFAADCILTAHTADDQAETVLMRLVRGCGVDGLEGIAMKRGNVCRPLLCCTRSEIEEYCARHNLRYVDDETNDNTQFLRNDVRHRLLPMLKEMNPSVVDALLRLSDCARSDAAYLNVQARELLDASRLDDSFSVATLLSQCDAVRRRALRLLLRDIPLSSIEEDYILAVDKVLLSGKGAVCVADGYRLLVEQGVLYVRSVTEDEIPGPHYIEYLSGDVRFGSYNCLIAEQFNETANFNNLLSQSAVDCDKITGKLYLRARQTGDYLHPADRGVGKSIKKLMNEWRIPAHLRDGYPLLCDDSGVILVPGYACDERVKVTQNTNHYLVCEIDAVQG